MDAASKQALFERGKEGRGYRGEVTKVGQDEIALSMNFDVPRQVVWSKSRQTITIEGIEGDAGRPRTVMQCQEVTPRTMIEFHRRPAAVRGVLCSLGKSVGGGNDPLQSIERNKTVRRPSARPTELNLATT